MRATNTGPWFGFIVAVLRPLLMVLTRRDWRGVERLPRSGGVILAVNHLSYTDPLLIGHLCYDNGRIPRFLAKIELFRLPVVGVVLRGAGQIPVYRRSANASLALRAAVDALQAGECVVIYPEGTTTKDPDYWPMLAKTGVARLALLSGSPVIPVAQWGAQQIMGHDRKLHLRRTDVHLAVGEPVDLSPWQGKDLTVDNLRAATDLVMSTLRAMVSELRGEPAPERVFDPRTLHVVTEDDAAARRSA